MKIDARVPVAFGSNSAGAHDLIVVIPPALPGHEAQCSCCVARTPAAALLGQAFQQRARGQVAFFRRVLVVTDAGGVASVQQALRNDPLVAAWFRAEADDGNETDLSR